MNCVHCGNPLSPGSTSCAYCGASVAASAEGVDAPQGSRRTEQSAAQPISIPHSPHMFRPQTAFYGRYGGMRGNAALPPPSSLSLPDTHSPAEDAKRASTVAIAPAPTDEAAPPKIDAAPAPIAPGSQQNTSITISFPPRPKRSLDGRLVVLGGILALIALLVSLSAFGYNVYKKNLTETRATATAAARLHATATAGAQATATASVPLFIDSLASNTNGWLENGTSAFFAGNQYHLHNSDPTMTLNSYYQGQTFDNFKIQITVTAYSDADPSADVPYAYGLILRADPNTPADKYVFFVSPDGTYNFARHDADGFIDNGWTDLSATSWASSSAIHTGKGATNTLAVIALDNNFTLFINGQQLETVTDSYIGYTSGWIGTMVEGADMEAGFSHLQIYGPGA
jgi:hypothetical protein